MKLSIAILMGHKLWCYNFSTQGRCTETCLSANYSNEKSYREKIDSNSDVDIKSD